MSATETGRQGVRLAMPAIGDASEVANLVRSCPPLDHNSTYAYLLLCHHFRDTCVIARGGDRIVGFVSAYRIPTPPSDRIFVWQVAVHPDWRGRGLAKSMLEELLVRPHCRDVRWLETTIGPSNRASESLFRGLARRCRTKIATTALFDRAHFRDDVHEDEVLYRVGPITAGTAPATEEPCTT